MNEYRELRQALINLGNTIATEFKLYTFMDWVETKLKNLNNKKNMKLAIQEAKKSNCLRKRCGTVIVKNNEVIGKGFNSPPGNKILHKCIKDDLPTNFKSDRTCCVHAEQRAIMDALRHNPNKIEGSTLYFIRIDNNGDMVYSGAPYCTICSKMALDVGIKEFVLWHKKGITIYSTDIYNKLSFGLL